MVAYVCCFLRFCLCFIFVNFIFCTFDALAFTDELFKSWDALAVNNDSRIMMHDKRGKHGIVKNHCYGLDANCIDYGGFSIANGGFLIASPNDILRERPGFRVTRHGSFGKNFAWLPVKEVPGASETISEWEKATRQNDLTDCKEGTCVSFENVKSNELGACLVPVIDGQRGAPIRCDSLLFHEDGVDYIRVISGTTTLSFSMGRPDFKFTVYIPANESSKIVLDAFSDALQSTPLSLKTRIGSSYVIGTSSFRPSPILYSLFDIVTARIDCAHFSRNTNIDQVQCEISTTLYVSNRRTDRINDWHLPSEQQTTEYTNKILTLFHDALKKKCNNLYMVDSFSSCCNSGPDIGEQTTGGYDSVHVDFSYSPERDSWN